MLRNVNQLHPFIDGNIRTCYIMLNRLLDHYNLGKTILTNPNRFDMCSLNELTKDVEEGQINYCSLVEYCKNPNPKGEFILMTSDANTGNQVIRCKPDIMKDLTEDLSERFLNDVIINETKGDYCEYKPINESLAKKDYGLALRQACCGAGSKLIKKIIDDFSYDIDFTKTTSKGELPSDLIEGNRKIKEPEKRKEIIDMLAQKITEQYISNTFP